ncbi:MAG: hypothetical protein JRI34_12835 [Deltaproteobacteria bacterium]|nr:hypothetical protein [Deltaproteobacteria bacterium]
MDQKNLKIKSFWGTSKNAVLIQIWCALIYYLILAFIEAQSRYQGSLHELTEIIGVVLFIRTSMFNLFCLDLKTIDRVKNPPPLQMTLPVRI